MAGWMVVLGSVFAVATAFEVVGGARSLGTREAIERFLAEPPGSTMGLEVESVVILLQGTATAAAVIAAMTAVLGFYALRGDRRARTAMAALAVPLFLTGLAVGGFLTSLVAAACALLYASPSREWFDGKPIPATSFGGFGPGQQERKSGSGAGSPRPDQPSRGPGPDAGQHGGTPPGQHGGTPPGQHGGTPPGQPADRPYGTPYTSPSATATQAPWPSAGTPGPQQGRPPSVSVAVALTLVMTSLVLLLSLVGLVAVLAAPDLMIDEMLRARPDLLDQGMTRELVVVTAITTTVAMVIACLLAIGFAVALLTGKKWGATGLLVMCVLTAVFCMLAALSSLLTLLPGVAALLVLTNVRHRDTRAWVRR